MEIQSCLNYAHVSSQKARLIVDQIRGLSVDAALKILNFSKKKSAIIVKSLLNSAIANAENNHSMDIDILYISAIYVNNGPITKRFRARAKGRGNKVLKRFSHITLKLIERK